MNPVPAGARARRTGTNSERPAARLPTDAPEPRPHTCAAITSVTHQGGPCLAGVLGVASHRVVGRATADHLRTSLVTEATPTVTCLADRLPAVAPDLPEHPDCPRTLAAFTHVTGPLRPEDVCEALGHEPLPKNVDGTRAKLKLRQEAVAGNSPTSGPAPPTPGRPVYCQTALRDPSAADSERSRPPATGNPRFPVRIPHPPSRTPHPAPRTPHPAPRETTPGSCVYADQTALLSG